MSEAVKSFLLNIQVFWDETPCSSLVPADVSKGNGAFIFEVKAVYLTLKLKTLFSFETSEPTPATTQTQVPEESTLPRLVTVVYECCLVDRDSSVGIATLYRLDVPGSNPGGGGGEIFNTNPDRTYPPPQPQVREGCS